MIYTMNILDRIVTFVLPLQMPSFNNHTEGMEGKEG